MSDDILPGGIGANSLSDPDARPETPAAGAPADAVAPPLAPPQKRGRGQRKIRDKPISKARRKPDAKQRSATAKAEETPRARCGGLWGTPPSRNLLGFCAARHQ